MAHASIVVASLDAAPVQPSGPGLLAVLASGLVLGAVLAWPRRRIGRIGALLGGAPLLAPVAAPSKGVESIWRADPLELWRARRARRDRDDERLALAILDIAGPALRAGLTAERALELALTTTGDPLADPPGRPAPPRSAAAPVAAFWRGWAEVSGSDEIAFVAGAWALSEQTGAPLADAVDVGAEQVRARMSHRRRLRAATAGPQATVQVLSLLPLTGPLFGLAAGVGPGELYLASPATGGSLALGLGLLVLGRWWCRRLVLGAGRTR